MFFGKKYNEDKYISKPVLMQAAITLEVMHPLNKITEDFNRLESLVDDIIYTYIEINNKKTPAHSVLSGMHTLLTGITEEVKSDESYCELLESKFYDLKLITSRIHEFTRNKYNYYNTCVEVFDKKYSTGFIRICKIDLHNRLMLLKREQTAEYLESFLNHWVLLEEEPDSDSYIEIKRYDLYSMVEHTIEEHKEFYNIIDCILTYL